MNPLVGIIAILIGGLVIPFLYLKASTRMPLRAVIVPVLLGLGLLAATLIIQPVIQAAPLVALNVDRDSIAFIAYSSLVSGLLQEGLKLSAVKRYQGDYRALWVGLGFGGGEALLVAYLSGLSYYAGQAGGAATFYYLLSAYERLLATTFHVASTAILATAHWRLYSRYALAALLHSLLNFTPAYIAGGRDIASLSIDALAFMYAGLTLLVIITLILALRGVSLWRRAGMLGMGL